MTFSEHQPKRGDLVLHCGHLDVNPHEWTEAVPPFEFVRPDGSKGSARWLMECPDCFKARNFTSNFQLRGEAIWGDDAPVIKNMPLSGLEMER